MKTKDSNIVSHLIGDFGKWQAIISLLLSLLKLPIGWFQLSIVFLAPITDFWCATPKTSDWSWSDDTTPMNRTNYTLNSCDAECSEYVFNTTVFKTTIISEWLLICDKEQLANVVQMSFMFGVLIGNVMFGIASDRFGRKNPLVVAIAVQSITSLLTAFVPWFLGFLLLRFLLAIATGGIMVTSFVLCVEMVGGKWRTSIPILYQIPFGLANSIMAIMAYFLRDWRNLTFTMSVISLSFLSYWWMIPESPRWLLAMGENDRAAQILSKAAKTNGSKSKDFASILTSLNDTTLAKKEPPSKSPPFFRLFRTPRLRRTTLTLFFNWFVAGLSVFGFSQYISFIGKNEDIFVHFTIGGLVTIPGTLLCIFFVKRFGRKRTIIVSGLTYGLTCILVTAFPSGAYAHDWPKILFAAISLTSMSVAFPALYLYAGELLPTVARNGGLGVSSMFARIGSMTAPFVLSARNSNEHAPLFILGGLPIIAVLLLIPLPETKERTLPDTFEEGENFGRNITQVSVVEEVKNNI
ncbi:hypothetical protein RUM43_010298 [Polyplax serrata]|uniref:Major facilitator superfamily (MFS) profile domain-containing protein n=1 Tax=Polyplax serrata TaxID=468196 RepID=A0AAN8PKD2_POLSC